MMLTASDDKSVKIWRVAKRQFLSSFSQQTNWVRAAKFSPNGKMIATVSDDKSLRIYDVNTGECTRTITEERGAPRQVAWHPWGNMVAVALGCNRIKIFDVGGSQLLQLYVVHSAPVNDRKFSDDCTIRVLDLLEGRPIYTLTGHTAAVNAVGFSQDGEKFATGGNDRQLLVWQSNLHTYDASQFEAKSALLSSSCDTSVASVYQQSNASSTALSNDHSIRIDMRESHAYNILDENFQVLDSEHTKLPETPKSASKSSSVGQPKAMLSHAKLVSKELDFKPRSTSPRFF
ncbi:GL25362 [Drosophila persimilis]|uniref:GL25362 n=1 Tax=Drosophila persimilis TaxID=7234 RepID=B4HCV7_DROPE|nr:GL25362 [Drosophila persimilis]